MPTSPTSACSGGCRTPPAFAASAALDRAALGLPTEADMSRPIAGGAASTGIANWTFFLAFSFFRLAAICQGVYKRALDGNASNPEKAKHYGEAVVLLAGLAVGLIDEQEE